MSEEIKSIVENGLAQVKSVQDQLKTALDAHTAEIEINGKASTALTGKIDGLSEQYKSLRDELADLAQKQSPASVDAQVKTAGQEFVSSEMYKAMASGQREKARIEVKNTVVTGPNMPFEVQRDGVIPGSFAPLTIRQQIPTITVASNSVSSLRELAWTSGAVEVSEAAAKPESSITFEPYNVQIEVVAHFIKVSNQLLADAPAVAAYIDTRLRDGLAQRVDRQLLLGTGVTPQLSGLTDAGNFVAFTATSSANLVESINKAKYNRWAVGEVVDTVIVNPADWAAMEVLREGAGSGTYLYGAPGTNAGAQPFGVSVVMSPFMPAGQFLIGALRSSAIIYQRQGAVVEMGYVNNDFTNNLITIRAEERLGLGVDRPMGLMYGAITAI
jgi:HK97 family phage major capsid protein